MRILHVTRDFPPRSRGGISTAVGGLAEQATRRGHDVAVLSFDDWRPKRQRRGPEPTAKVEGSVPVLRLDSADSLPAARAFAQDFDAELVQVHHGMLWADARDLGRRTLLMVHVDQAVLNDLRGVEQTLSSEAQRTAIAEADAVVAPSHAAARRLAARWARSVQAASLGIEDVAPSARPGAGVVSVGRFDRSKGTEDLLTAASRIDAPVTLIGGVPGNPKAERRWLKRMQGVRVVGWVSPRERDALVSAAALAVQPSHEETFGLAALEAMRLGVPVVAADCAAHRELLEGCGLLVEPGDSEALAVAMRRVLADPADLALRGLERARQHRWDAVWPQWARLYG